MDFIYRVRFPVINQGYLVRHCDCLEYKTCCDMPDFSIFPPPPPPVAPHHSGFAVKTVVVIAVLSSMFLIASYYFLITKVCVRWRRLRAPVAGSEGSEEGDVDEIGDNPVNYVWYINTLGLEQSVINSITMCKYKKGDGLIEGTDCSVCLSEFKDNEDLRLLPKCSHAFHVACIDTWLRSHVNCPLCRARVVSDPANASAASQIAHESDNPNGVPRENVHSADRLDDNLIGQNFMGDFPFGVERGDRRLIDLEALNAALTPEIDWRGSVLSESGENHRAGDFALELQSIRRSVSMDSSAASKLHMSLAGELLIEQDREKKENLGEWSGLKRLGSFTKHGCNGNFSKIVGTGGKGSPFVSKLVAMKRSRSSSGTFFSSRYDRNRNSILPL